MGTIHLAVTLKLEERLVFIRRLHFSPSILSRFVNGSPEFAHQVKSQLPG